MNWKMRALLACTATAIASSAGAYEVTTHAQITHKAYERTTLHAKRASDESGLLKLDSLLARLGD